MKSVLTNLIAFKAGWAAVIVAAAASMPALGTLAVGVVVALHLLRTPDVRPEIFVLSAAAIIGLLWESVLVYFGLLEYRSGYLVPGMAPYWIVAMWVLFATTLNVGMRWMRKSTLVAALAGAIGGPLAFFAGERAGAVAFTDPQLSLVAIALGWTILLPALVRVAERFDGHRPVYLTDRAQ